jgi:hypothetical protein
MSAGGGGSASNQLLIGPAKKLVVILTIAVFAIGPGDTAAFAKSLITAIGYATGFVLGGLPTGFNAVKDGQSKMGGSGADKVTPPPAAKAPASPAAPKPKTPSRDATGNQPNNGTDAIR